MFPATRITPQVPYYGKLTYLSHTYSNGTSVNVPALTRPGDIVFAFTAGFDAGVSTNPGSVPTPASIFNNGSIDPATYPNILIGLLDTTNGSDESEAFLAYRTDLTAGTQLASFYNGANGDSNNMFSFGIRGPNGEDLNAKLSLVRHTTVGNINNTANGIEVQETGFFITPSGSSNPNLQNVHKNIKLNSDEIMLILLATIGTDNGPTESSYYYANDAGQSFVVDELSSATGVQYIGKFGSHFDGYINAHSVSSPDTSTASTMRVAYKVIYPDSSEESQYYRLATVDQQATPVISRMILRIS